MFLHSSVPVAWDLLCPAVPCSALLCPVLPCSAVLLLLCPALEHMLGNTASETLKSFVRFYIPASYLCLEMALRLK